MITMFTIVTNGYFILIRMVYVTVVPSICNGLFMLHVHVISSALCTVHCMLGRFSSNFEVSLLAFSLGLILPHIWKVCLKSMLVHMEVFHCVLSLLFLLDHILNLLTVFLVLGSS